MVHIIQAISTYVITFMLACSVLFIPVHADDESSPIPPSSESNSDNQDLIDYLEKQKAEQELKEQAERDLKEQELKDKEEKERIEKEEKEKLEEEEKRELLDRASFDSASDVIYGYANKYGYYFIGYVRSNNYSNYTYYGYYFTDLTQFEKIGNVVKFKNGKGKYVYCSNSNGCFISDLNNQFIIPSWSNIQSNIYEVDYPAITSIDKTYLSIITFFSKIISAFVSIFVLYFLLNCILFNKGKR